MLRWSGYVARRIAQPNRDWNNFNVRTVTAGNQSAGRLGSRARTYLLARSCAWQHLLSLPDKSSHRFSFLLNLLRVYCLVVFVLPIWCSSSTAATLSLNRGMLLGASFYLVPLLTATTTCAKYFASEASEKYFYHLFSLKNQFVYRIMTCNNMIESFKAKNFISLWRSEFHNSLKILSNYGIRSSINW